MAKSTVPGLEVGGASKGARGHGAGRGYKVEAVHGGIMRLAAHEWLSVAAVEDGASAAKHRSILEVVPASSSFGTGPLRAVQHGRECKTLVEDVVICTDDGRSLPWALKHFGARCPARPQFVHFSWGFLRVRFPPLCEYCVGGKLGNGFDGGLRIEERPDDDVPFCGFRHRLEDNGRSQHFEMLVDRRPFNIFDGPKSILSIDHAKVGCSIAQGWLTTFNVTIPWTSFIRKTTRTFPASFKTLERHKVAKVRQDVTLLEDILSCDIQMRQMTEIKLLRETLLETSLLCTMLLHPARI
ncbi:hypothetical protein LshimejAT787_0704700 [Lyophyllum shimeji]|uniref:Uncharacterized protein n=1 Tax=Lyophyllum shimeji TaxID=47721 RepID=A0A9P3PNZ6_LYOSH|nr:hypothetical protein LshimejAT787_0704700 [Lyophyllum shimeji]